MNTNPKSIAIVSLTQFVYGPPKEALQNKLNHIIWKFKMTHPSGLGAFMFKGTIFTEPDYKPRERVPILRGELVPSMDAWLQEHRELLREIDQGTSILCCAVTRAYSKQELLQLLPESLHPALAEVPDFNVESQHLPQLNQNPLDFSIIKKRMLLNLIV